jgi:hypothetical protein
MNDETTIFIIVAASVAAVGSFIAAFIPFMKVRGKKKDDDTLMLLKVIEDRTNAIIQQTMSKDRVTEHYRDVQIGLLEFERIANNGISIKLNADTSFESDSNGKSYRQLQTWKIEADRWGRIKKMSQDGVPRYVLVEKIPTLGEIQVNGNKIEVELPKLPANEVLVPTNGNYGERYNSRSDMCISVTSNRRHWTN